MIAAIYSRKSKFSEKGESVENQVKMCEAYASTIGIEKFVVYEDEGFSGGNIERPQYQKMMKEAKNKKFDYLICYRLDRISRNVSDFTQTIEELKRHKIEFISIKEQFDTSSPMGRAMMNISAVFAQLERETIAERVRDNMMELSKTGRWLGGTTPLGFKSEPVKYNDSNGKDKKMYKLIEVLEEMETVKLIYNLYLEKKGFSSVANYLCKNYYTGKNGGEFSRQTVQQIVTNPVYCIADTLAFEHFKNLDATIYGEAGLNGFMVYNKREGGKKDKPIDKWIFAIGEHRGIIASSDWIECQKINEHNKLKASPRSGTGNKFLLASMVTCGYCGSGMASWSHNNKKSGKMEKYYRCNLKTRASNRCNNKMLNAYKAEDLIIDSVKNANIELLIKNIELHKKEVEVTNSAAIEVIRIKKEIELNNKTRQGLIRKSAFMDDDPETIEMFKQEISEMKKENIELEIKIKEIEVDSETLEKINKQNISVDEIISSLAHFKKYIDYADGVEAKRELILNVVESIVWYGESETLEVNLIGSGKVLPRGTVLARNLCYGSTSRCSDYRNTSMNTNPLLIKL